MHGRRGATAMNSSVASSSEARKEGGDSGVEMSSASSSARDDKGSQPPSVVVVEDDEGIGSEEASPTSSTISGDSDQENAKVDSPAPASSHKMFRPSPKPSVTTSSRHSMDNNSRHLSRLLRTLGLNRINPSSDEDGASSPNSLLLQPPLSTGRVFGRDLTEHLKETGNEIPKVVRICAECIERFGMVDGIYRLSGISSNIRALKNSFEESSEEASELILDPLDPGVRQDIHSISSLLKLYCRELPNPLCTFTLYPRFLAAAAVAEEYRPAAMRQVVRKLPDEHFRTLAFLMRHLCHVSQRGDETGMTAKNLAIVWAPNLLRSLEESLTGLAAGGANAAAAASAANAAAASPVERRNSRFNRRRHVSAAASNFFSGSGGSGGNDHLQDVAAQAVCTEALIRYCDVLFAEEADLPAAATVPFELGISGDGDKEVDIDSAIARAAKKSQEAGDCQSIGDKRRRPNSIAISTPSSTPFVTATGFSSLTPTKTASSIVEEEEEEADDNVEEANKSTKQHSLPPKFHTVINLERSQSNVTTGTKDPTHLGQYRQSRVHSSPSSLAQLQQFKAFIQHKLRRGGVGGDDCEQGGVGQARDKVEVAKVEEKNPVPKRRRRAGRPQRRLLHSVSALPVSLREEEEGQASGQPLESELIRRRKRLLLRSTKSSECLGGLRCTRTNNSTVIEDLSSARRIFSREDDDADEKKRGVSECSEEAEASGTDVIGEVEDLQLSFELEEREMSMMNCTLEEEEEECGRNEDSDEEAEDLRKTKSTKVPYTKRSQRKKHLVDAEESSGNNTSNNMTPTSNDKSNIPTASAKNSGKLSLRQRVARRFASPSSKKISREENISSSSADIVSRKMSATLKAKVASVLGTNRNKGLFNPPTLGTLEDDVNIYSCSMQGLSQDHGCPGGGRGKGKKKGSVNAASIVDIGLVRRRVMAEMAINSAGEEASSSSSASSSGNSPPPSSSSYGLESSMEEKDKENPKSSSEDDNQEESLIQELTKAWNQKKSEMATILEERRAFDNLSYGQVRHNRTTQQQDSAFESCYSNSANGAVTYENVGPPLMPPLQTTPSPSDEASYYENVEVDECKQRLSRRSLSPILAGCGSKDRSKTRSSSESRNYENVDSPMREIQDAIPKYQNVAKSSKTTPSTSASSSSATASASASAVKRGSTKATKGQTQMSRRKLSQSTASYQNVEFANMRRGLVHANPSHMKRRTRLQQSKSSPSLVRRRSTREDERETKNPKRKSSLAEVSPPVYENCELLGEETVYQNVIAHRGKIRPALAIRSQGSKDESSLQRTRRSSAPPSTGKRASFARPCDQRRASRGVADEESHENDEVYAQVRFLRKTVEEVNALLEGHPQMDHKRNSLRKQPPQQQPHPQRQQYRSKSVGSNSNKVNVEPAVADASASTSTASAGSFRRRRVSEDSKLGRSSVVAERKRTLMLLQREGESEEDKSKIDRSSPLISRRNNDCLQTSERRKAHFRALLSRFDSNCREEVNGKIERPLQASRKVSSPAAVQSTAVCKVPRSTSAQVERRMRFSLDSQQAKRQ